MHADGSCPTCGRVLEARAPLRPAVAPRTPSDEDAAPSTSPSSSSSSSSKAPWHFKLLLSVLVVYLGWRGVQGVEWVAHHI